MYSMKKYLLFIGLYLFGISSICKAIIGLRIHPDDGFYGFIYADYGVLFWVIWIISVVLIITGLGLYLYDEIKKRQK